MKRIITYFFIVVLFTINVSNVLALSVDKSSITLERGKSTDVLLYVTSESEIDTISFTMDTSTNDITAIFTPDTYVNDVTEKNIKHSLKLTNQTTGKILLGKITITSIQTGKEENGIITIQEYNDDNTINFSTQEINVKITDIELVPKKEERKKLAVDERTYISDHSYEHTWMNISISLVILLLLALLLSKIKIKRRRRH